MDADFNHDDWMDVLLVFDKAQGQLIFRISAKKDVRIDEIQGFTSDVEAFGLSLPAGFTKKQFGDGAVIPDEMKSDMEHMNRLQFRWGCNVPVKAGGSAEICIPAAGAGKEKACLTLGYEYPRLFGLLKGRNGMYARLSPG